MSENAKTCTGPECERRVRANGLCATHAQQKLRGRDLIPIGSYIRPAKEGCEFPECGRKHYAHGLCFQHYKQKRAGNDLKPIKADQKENESE
ncbi:hypothetical protein ACIPRU_03610 [Streptomyces sp. NPDC090126]|uniref:hypothetical protein n=1 Tax=Streptomyces sp. NPDC090126 TaxID=3365952 RepID=UPI0037F9F34E